MNTLQDDRKEILARIKKALKTAAPRHSEKHGHDAAREAVADTPPLEQEQSPSTQPSEVAREFTNQLPIVNNTSPADFQQWMPRVGATLDEQLKLFAALSADLKTEFVLCESEDEAREKLAAMAQQNNWKTIATHKGELTTRILAPLELTRFYTDDANDYAVMDLEKCEVGVTECEALVAQTGSVLVTGKSSGGRALSVLPPHHIVLARRAQMLPDLSAAFAHLKKTYGEDIPSMMSFITGPSRTGDIERILVLGAHGPKRLTVICF